MEELYVSEDITRHKYVRGQIFYYVKWQGFGEDENTWEPEENLIETDILKEYQQKAGVISQQSISSEDKKLTISEIVGIVESSNIENPIYIVRIQGEKKYTEMASSDIQMRDPLLLIEFLESCLSI